MIDITILQVVLVSLQMLAPFVASVALLIAARAYAKKISK